MFHDRNIETRLRAEPGFFLPDWGKERLCLRVNGEERAWGGRMLLHFLQAEGYDPARVAVERNGVIVPKAAYGETALAQEDILEIVQFVGGG